MTRAEIKEIKKIINQGKHYRTYFKRDTGELRVIVFEHNTYYGPLDKDKERNSILDLLNKLVSGGLRPRFKIDRKRYQGYLDFTYVVFY